jgi:hypothetical protein
MISQLSPGRFEVLESAYFNRLNCAPSGWDRAAIQDGLLAFHGGNRAGLHLGKGSRFAGIIGSKSGRVRARPDRQNC